MNGITYQEAVARIDSCIAGIRAAAAESGNLEDWLEVGYLTYELDRFMAGKRKDVENAHYQQDQSAAQLCRDGAAE